MLKEYLADKTTDHVEPTAQEMITEQDRVHPTGMRLEPGARAATPEDGRTLAGWEEARREQLALVKDSPEEEPTLKELQDRWLKSQEPDGPEQPVLAPAQVVVDLQIRVSELETMMGQVFTHLMEKDS